MVMTIQEFRVEKKITSDTASKELIDRLRAFRGIIEITNQ